MSAHLFSIIHPHVSTRCYPWRRIPLGKGVGALLLLFLPLLIALFAPGAAVADLTLGQVGAPIPGQGPVGLAVAETSGGTYPVIADNTGNQVRSYRIDRSTGTLSPVGAVPLPNGPSAVAISPGGRFGLVTTLRGNDVTSYRIDPQSGTLSPVGAVPTGGNGPVNLDISNDGFAVIANKDSDSLGVVQIDPQSGTLSPVGAVPVGDAPNDVKVTGRRVLVGHAISNDVHLLQLNRFGALFPLDVKSVGASRVTSIATWGPLVAAGTFAGEVHWFLIGLRRLFPLGVTATGGDITDIAFSDWGTLFVTGGIPGRVAAFGLTHDLELEQVGSLLFPGPPTSRTLATVRGFRWTTWVLANEFQGNQTRVIKVQRDEDEDED